MCDIFELLLDEFYIFSESPWLCFTNMVRLTSSCRLRGSHQIWMNTL